jgi:hypothetical protein
VDYGLADEVITAREGTPVALAGTG